MVFPFSAKYVLDELGLSLGCKSKFIPRKSKTLKRSNGVYELNRWDGTVRLSRCADFTQLEKNFIKTIINSYDKLYAQLDTRGVAHQYQQTAIMSSVFDIGVSRFIAKSRSHFLNVHRLIQYFKFLSYHKYEGEQIKIGCFVMKSNDVERQEFGFSGTSFERFPVANKVRINNELISDSAFLRYVNGQDSFYICNSSLDITGVLNVSFNSHDCFRTVTTKYIDTLVRNDDDVYFYIGVTSSGDIELIVGDNCRILFRKGRWYFIDCWQINNLLSPNYIEISPWRVFYAMSKIKRGTVSLIVDKDDSELEELVVRHTSSDSGMRSAIKDGILESNIDHLCSTGELMRILTTDGMTVFNNSFSNILDFNCIVDTGQASVSQGGGGRTSAAIAGSNYGVSIKVSEDGPISIYKNEKCIYCIG